MITVAMPSTIDAIATYFAHVASLIAESLSPERQLLFAKRVSMTDAKPCVFVCMRSGINSETRQDTHEYCDFTSTR
eukprot:2931-Heterococcus_DN1.PRE.8